MRHFSVSVQQPLTMRLMCQGREKLEHHMQDYKKRKDHLSKKEQDTYEDMRIVQEMYARGFEFYTN